LRAEKQNYQARTNNEVNIFTLLIITVVVIFYEVNITSIASIRSRKYSCLEKDIVPCGDAEFASGLSEIRSPLSTSTPFSSLITDPVVPNETIYEFFVCMIPLADTNKMYIWIIR